MRLSGLSPYIGPFHLSVHPSLLQAFSTQTFSGCFFPSTMMNTVYTSVFGTLELRGTQREKDALRGTYSATFFMRSVSRFRHLRIARLLLEILHSHLPKLYPLLLSPLHTKPFVASIQTDKHNLRDSEYK